MREQDAVAKIALKLDSSLVTHPKPTFQGYSLRILKRPAPDT